MSAQKDNDEDVLPLDEVLETELDTEETDDIVLSDEEEELAPVSEDALLDDLL
ncbi:MAG: hypothetical protein WCK88_01400 [bacterium]